MYGRILFPKDKFENAIIFTHKYFLDKYKFKDVQIHSVQTSDFYFIWYAPNSTYVIISTGSHVSTSLEWLRRTN